MSDIPVRSIDSVAVIPAFNGSATIREVIEGVRAWFPLERIVVVDDGSTDATSRIVLELGVTLLRHPYNLGKGAALETAFRSVRGRTDVAAVLTLDADLQHPPAAIPAFFETMNRTGCDLVLGARRKAGTAMPVHRRLSNALTSRLVSIRTGAAISDSQCGFRLIRRLIVDAVSLTAHGYEAETEFLLKAVRRGCSVASTPIATVYGRERSYMTHWETTRNFVRILMREY